MTLAESLDNATTDRLVNTTESEDPANGILHIPVVNLTDCKICTVKPGDCDSYRAFPQFCPCKVGIKPEDTPWCKVNLCVNYDEHDNEDTAACKPAMDQAEYMAMYYSAEGVAKVILAAKNQSLLRGDDPDPPQQAIMLYEKAGSDLLVEAIKNDAHWPYLLMPGYIKTEAWWSYCGLSTLTLALNYLSVPPPFYMGLFRWWSEVKVLDLYPVIKKKIDEDPPGIELDELACIATDFGLTADPHPRGKEDDFRKALQQAMAPATFKSTILLVNYHRMLVGQPGAGHWSPITAYAAKSDKVLIADVARYKWPLHWVRVSDLIRAMDTVDDASHGDRGFMLLRQGGQQANPLRTCANPPQTINGNQVSHNATWAPEDDGLTEKEVRDVMTSGRPLWH